MEEDLKMNGSVNKSLLGFCRKCHDYVFLRVSSKESKDGKMRVKGDCFVCGNFVKFISRKESSL